MAILLDEKTRVLIQGITGREGSTRARFMSEYGTNVVAGVTPGRGGTEVWRIPVYNTRARKPPMLACPIKVSTRSIKCRRHVLPSKKCQVN
jgi:GDP-D-mannose dehydratase